jgi:anaerobic magnesium-protoporphyrin IX monomethyl ester cyclase
MADLDCLILGFYDYSFPKYVELLRRMGTESGSYQDLSLAFIEYEGRPMRALDAFTRFYQEGRPGPHKLFHNADFLWPVVAYLTTYLRRRDFDVAYVNLPHLEKDRMRELIESGVRSVAITTTLYVSPHPIFALADEIRRLSPNVPIIVGGPYIANQTQLLGRAELTALFDYLGCDIYVLCQEGEATLARLLGAIHSGRMLDTVPNLAFKDKDGQFKFTMPQPESNDLAENVIDYRPFRDASLGEFLSIRTAKSCPFACAFCGFPERAGAYKYLDVPSVERLLNAVADAGKVTTLTFLDDTFNVPKARFKELLRMIIRNQYDFRWNCLYRADHGDDETIDLMAESKCEGVFLGVESGSDQMLERMNKSARRKHYLHTIPRLKACGISTYASLIVGFPGETDETVRETIELIEEAAPEYYRTQLWYADPVTPIWKKREAYNITGEGFGWTHRTMNVRHACDWINRIFLEIKNSEWLPQFGFEQWSVFYLSRLGMTRPQIRHFVNCFNAVIKHTLLTGAAQTPPALIDKLRSSCQFEHPGNEGCRL